MEAGRKNMKKTVLVLVFLFTFFIDTNIRSLLLLRLYRDYFHSFLECRAYAAVSCVPFFIDLKVVELNLLRFFTSRSTRTRLLLEWSELFSNGRESPREIKMLTAFDSYTEKFCCFLLSEKNRCSVRSTGRRRVHRLSTILLIACVPCSSRE